MGNEELIIASIYLFGKFKFARNKTLRKYFQFMKKKTKLFINSLENMS